MRLEYGTGSQCTRIPSTSLQYQPRTLDGSRHEVTISIVWPAAASRRPISKERVLPDICGVLKYWWR